MEKKLTALLLALLCVLLPACGGDTPVPPAETTAAPETTEAPQPITVTAGEYVIVRAEGADETIVTAAASLYSAFNAAGIKVTLTTDWERPGTDPATRHPREILVGPTNRDESVDAAKRVRAADYLVEVTGERIVICGGTSAMTAAACTAFAETYLAAKTEALTLARGLLMSVAGSYAVNTVTLAGKPLTDYTIAYTAFDYTPAAEQLRTAVMGATGFVLPIAALNETANTPLIVVGLPEQDDLARLDAPAELLTLDKASTDHILAQVGDNLFLVGRTEWTATDAANAFVTAYLTGKTGDIAIEVVSERGAMSLAEPLYAEADLRVMTYNVYGSSGDTATRYPYTIGAIRRAAPDVLGLQEANKTAHTQVIGALSDLYAQVAPKTDVPDATNHAPILYRKDKIKLIEASAGLLRSCYTGTNTKALTVAVLEVIATGERFIVTNLHGALILSSYPVSGTDAVEGAKWREDNVAEMVEKMNALKQKYGDLPTLSTGDFNFNASAKAYADALALGLCSADTAATVAADRDLTTYTGKVGASPSPGKAIDFIFVGDRVNVYTHRIMRDPDATRGSDHCPVYADISFVK